MRKVLCIALAFILTSCGNSDGSSSSNNINKKLVGYSENALTLREIAVPTVDGTIHVKCYLDHAAKERCEGQFADGNSASVGQIQAALSTLQIDPKIEAALEAKCDGKTLLLRVDPKIVFPAVDESEFCFRSSENNTVVSCNGNSVSLSEAEATNNKRLEKLKSDILSARKDGLDKFVKLNPELISEDKQKAYLDSLYGALEINISACDWQSFIEKNSDILDIVEFRGLVEKEEHTSCTNPIQYKVLLKANNHSERTKDSPSYKLIQTSDELLSYKSLGLTESVVNSIDFSKEVVVYLSGGEKPTVGYLLQLDEICFDSKIKARIVHCAGKDEGEELSDPIMLIQLPKNEYDVEFSNRDILCE